VFASFLCRLFCSSYHSISVCLIVQYYDDDPQENYANMAEIQKSILKNPQSPKTPPLVAQRSPGLVIIVESLLLEVVF
jgi:hypothetical protein